MFSRKLSIQTFSGDARIVAAVTRGRPAVLKFLDPNPGVVKQFHDASPDTVFIGRIVDNSLSGKLDAANGKLFAERCAKEADLCQHMVRIWEGANEAADGNNGLEALKRLNEFEYAFAVRCNELGLLPMVCGLSTGVPDITPITANGPNMSQWEVLYPAMQVAFGFHFHEYWNPKALLDTWNAYRFLKFWAYLPVWARVKPCNISELGVDGGLCGDGRSGYQNYPATDAVHYIAMLRNYDFTLSQYPTIVATIFAAGGWGTYDVVGTVLDTIADEQANAPAAKWGVPPVLAAPPPVVTPPPVVPLPGKSAGWCPFATQRPLTTHNYWDGRTDSSGTAHAVKAVVMHIAAGPMRAVYPTFNAPGGVSAHFCIGIDGYLEQYVGIYDTAWHAGLGWENGHWVSPGPGRPVVVPTWQGLEPGVNPNFTTIGIEHAGQPEDEWTPQMTAVNQRLLVWIAQQLGWSSYTAHANLVGHYEIDPLNRPNCPGPHVYYDALAKDANERLAIVAPPSLPTDAAHRWRSIVAVRNGARSLSHLSLNPDSALMKAALAQSMGLPLTDEFQVPVDGVTVVAQVFQQGILFADMGKWDNIQKA